MNFEFHRADSVDDASASLKNAADGMLLAGGMTLIPSIKLDLTSPSHLVDLGGLGELASIDVSADAVVIGAMTRHADVAANAEVAKAIPALAQLAGEIGDAQVRHRGTIGGSIANNDPAADYPAGCIGLGATIKTNQRELAADEFFTGLLETALQDGEIVTAISFPVPQKAAYRKFPNPASRYAMVGVFVAVGTDGVRVAVTGAGGSGVFRASAMEEALTKDFSSAALEGVSVDASDLLADVHAGSEYRAHIVGVMAQRAVADCG